MPRDYLRSSWEAIALSKGFQADEVCSIEFRFYRFKLAPIGQVDTWINAPGAYYHISDETNGSRLVIR